LSGQSITRLFGDGIVDALRAIRFAGSQALGSQAHLDYGSTAVRADGSALVVRTRLSLIRNGPSSHVLCTIRLPEDGWLSDAMVGSDQAMFRQLFTAFPLPSYVWRHTSSGFVLIDHNGASGLHDQNSLPQLYGSSPSAVYAEGSDFAADILRCYVERKSFERAYRGYRPSPGDPPKSLSVLFLWAEPDLVMVVVHDVTAERAALSEIRRLSSAVEQTADAVFITGPDGTIEYVNPAFEMITGLGRAEALGQNPHILKSGKMTAEYYQRLWNTLLSGEPFRGQTVNRRSDGSNFVAEQTITPLKDDDGRVTHYVSVLKDMTERMRLHERETEHRLAGMVQKRLFPATTPQVAGYEIAGAVFPAVDTSGDYFDYINMRDGAIGIAVADVYGHGMGPAIIMSEARAFIRSAARHESDPREILAELNRQIEPDLDDGGFITALFARLDPAQHVLVCANAGNWPLYVLDSNGRVVGERRTDGVPVGVFAELDLRASAPIRMEPGSLAVLITDGIPEAADAAGRPFGLRRLLATVRKHRKSPAQEIVARVREAVLSFTGTVEQGDDQTIAVVKRLALE
jgi:PAS domain S-box-containing protein